MATEKFHSPTGERLQATSSMGYRSDPFTGEKKFHAGMDIGRASGASMGEGVEAAWSGTVVYAGKMSGYGNIVIIDHGNGITTRYGHLSKIDVQKGQRVSQGNEIGNVGSTGRSTAPHLHFEIRENNKPVNPSKYFARSIDVSYSLSADPSIYARGGGGGGSGPSEEDRMEQARLEAEKQRKEAEAKAAEEERQRNIAAQNVNAMLGDELFGMVQGFMQLSNLAGDATVKRQQRVEAGIERPLNTPASEVRASTSPVIS